MPNRYIKRCLQKLIIKKMPIKTTRRYYFTSIHTVFIMVASLYITTNSVQVFHFLYIFINTFYCFIFYNNHYNRSFKYEEEMKTFSDVQNLRKFSTTRPALQEMMKEDIPPETKRHNMKNHEKSY